jgi:hypothetical protein
MGGSLTKFIKQECFNWYREEKHCIFHGQCFVMKGKPCTYFKRSVLPPPDYKCKHKCLVDDPVFEDRVRSEYRAIDSTLEIGRKFCDCGAAIPPRKKYCPKCSAKRAREQKRKWKRKNRG